MVSRLCACCTIHRSPADGKKREADRAIKYLSTVLRESCHEGDIYEMSVFRVMRTAFANPISLFPR